MPIAAVIFDCDGVLVDSEVIAVAVELECLAEIGLDYERQEFIERHLGQTMAEFYAALDHEHRRRFARPLPDHLPARVSERTSVRIEAELVAIAGVHATVTALATLKAVASGSAMARLEHKLRKTGLLDVFAPHVYSSEMVARGKPAPDIYLHVARQLAVDPKACVAVEDSLNGVRAAAAAGMTVIGFTGGGHCGPHHAARLKDAGAAHVTADMAELLEIVDRL